MTENTYKNMVRAAIAADANLKRHNMYGDAALVNVGATSFFEHELLHIVRTKLNKHNPSFAIGSITETPGFARKYADEKERILNNLQDDILLAEVQWKANMMRMEQQSAEKTAILLDEATALRTKRGDIQNKLREYYSEQLVEIGLITSRKVNFFFEGVSFNEGTVIAFANGIPIEACYTKSLQLKVKQLREKLGEGYNVAYFASDALGESEEEWLKTNIKARKTTQTGL